MTTGHWLLYGANGFTGRLIAEQATRRGLRPVLAGRRAQAIAPLAAQLGLEYRVFDLDDTRALDDALREVGTILLAAGPFSSTSRPVVDACLRTGAAYLDITGEIAVFESIFVRAAPGCVLLPGVGFDVVPSDCLAASLHGALPDTTHLELAFQGGGPPSRGTLRTMLEGLGLGGAIRANGQIRSDPLFSRTRDVPFHDRIRATVAIPWGDVSTAYYSTGISNIVVYRAFPRATARMLPVLRALLSLATLPPVNALLRRLVDRATSKPTAPGSESAQLWGRVSNASGRAVEGTLSTPQAYTLTALTAVECAHRVATGVLAPGAYTPSMAFGAGFITEFDGCELRVAAQ